MVGGIVNIILRSVSQGSGFKDYIDGARRLSAAQAREAAEILQLPAGRGFDRLYAQERKVDCGFRQDCPCVGA